MTTNFANLSVEIMARSTLSTLLYLVLLFQIIRWIKLNRSRI
jgi:hypothetical protein